MKQAPFLPPVVLACLCCLPAPAATGPANGSLKLTIPKGVELSRPFAEAGPTRRAGEEIEIPIRPKRVAVLWFCEGGR